MTWIVLLTALAAVPLLYLAARALVNFMPGQSEPNSFQGTRVLPYPTPAAASSGPVAATATTATLAAPTNGSTMFIEGFDLEGTGATAGSNISVTITGLLGGTLTIGVAIPTGATVFINPGSPAGLSYRFPTPLPASGPNTAITVNVPSFGTGNTFANVVAYGFSA